jgi:hypothetical protein
MSLLEYGNPPAKTLSKISLLALILVVELIESTGPKLNLEDEAIIW